MTECQHNAAWQVLAGDERIKSIYCYVCGELVKGAR